MDKALQDIVQVRLYLFSLYNCQYSDFFTALGKLEQALNRESLPPVNPDISKYWFLLFADYESGPLLGSPLCLLRQGDQGFYFYFDDKFFSVILFSKYQCDKVLPPLGESLCSAARVLSVSHSSLHGRYIRHHITGVEVFGPHVICILLFPDAFGVTEAYMDQELCRFIASGRLHAKIDKVGLTLTWMVLGDHLTSVNLNELWIISY